MSAHAFNFTTIDGTGLALESYRGSAVLIVNTASECGYTPQYAGLQDLWERYRDRGLVVLGVPSNDFGQQEPGTEAEIKAFCATNYGVTFPLTTKEPVIGAQAHPLYQWIGSEVGEAGAPRWNFHKYLMDRDGALCGAWPSAVEPLSEEITGAVEAALAD